jgi:MoxR-vWA-beta-propeller ternary system domain bpX0/MoxR-vWA-beta-propeller ternary system domain bpX1
MDIYDYFQSHSGYFWEWENELLTADSVFEALVIPGGNTIAYEHFVMETLNLLAPDGFPPFGSLLLALIATNANGEASIAKAFEIIDGTKMVQKEAEYPKAFTYARNFLNTLTGLPPEFKEGDKRKLLLQAVFKNCHNRVADHKAQNIMQQYNQQKHLLVRCAQKIPFSSAVLNKDIKTLAHLHVRFPTTDALLAAMGHVPELPELDKKISERQPAPATPANFINDLINEPKTYPVGSLIHRIWGGLNILLHHAAPSHQPLGGVSDLTNKGDFDKLLISEFANDDVVFMSRLANNEALYIKREVPPESDKFVRLLLVDCSIKNWGTSKILAFASALAIARHPKTDIECKIVALGNEYKEVEADTVAGVIDALNNLGSKLSAAGALQAVLDEHTDVKHSEVFLITSEDALASADMQRTLSDNDTKVKYIITAETGGDIYFYRIQNRGRKQIQHIYLPLEELWAKKPTVKSAKENYNRLKGDTAPAIDYPILLPPPKKRMAVFSLNKDEFYILTGSGALFGVQIVLSTDNNQYFRFHKGAELLLQNLSVSQNGVYSLQKNAEGEYILGAFYPKELYVSILNLNTREYHKKKISLYGDAAGYAVTNDDNGFYLFNDTDTVAEYFSFEVKRGELNITNIGQKSTLIRSVSSIKNRIEIFQKRAIENSVLLNFLPLYITQKNELQLNKYRLVFHKTSTSQANISLVNSRNTPVAVEAAYEKTGNRFVFPDGSAIYRDGLGMLTFKSSDAGIPTIYMPTTLHTDLAMATDAYFTGSKNYFKTEAGQKILPADEFEDRFLKPFIQTILNHGV